MLMSSKNVMKMLKFPNKQQKATGSIKMPSGSLYFGPLKNNLPQGRGTMHYLNDQRYEGDFHEGMKHGKGKYYYSKGQLYIGDWIMNKKQGKGQYFYQNGNRYTGDFHNNMKHGYGRIDELNGSYFLGHFNENNRDGSGEYYDAKQNIKYLQVYQQGQLKSNILIKQNGVGQQMINVPDLVKILTKESQHQKKQIVSEEFMLNRDGDVSSTKQQYISQGDPLRPSLLNLDSRLKTQEQNPAFIAQNYFTQKLLAKKISLWGKEEVSDWLNQIGFGDCIEDFIVSNIQGDSLLLLQNQDLKELNIEALGDRRILQRQIQFLRLIFKSQCLGDRISKLYQHQVTLDLVRELELKKNDIEDCNLVEPFESDSSSSSEEDQERQKKKAIKKKQSAMNMQWKVQSYLEKKGIKLTFLIPKQQIQIIRPIGKGGYGQVFQGRWLGQAVAVKKYMRKQGFRNRHVGHFLQQIQVINKLLHPSIVLYMGMCIYDNDYGMVTQFLSGGSLFDYLHKQRRSLSEERIFHICKDVALGMSYLHGKNVLHCDLKSSNVLIDQSWNVKLCDFGLSRIHTSNSKKKCLRVGTPHWMAPQILKGQKYEFESDVYSFGILLWQMLTCQIPYKDLTTSQIIGLVGNNQNHHISMPKSNNKLFLEIFSACTNRIPKKRPLFKIIVEALEKEQSKYTISDHLLEQNTSLKKHK